MTGTLVALSVSNRVEALPAIEPPAGPGPQRNRPPPSGHAPPLASAQIPPIRSEDGAGLIPEAGRIYAASDIWEGEERHFGVCFTERAVAFLDQHACTIDLARAELVVPGNKRNSLFNTNALYRSRTGKDAPPWLLYMPRIDLFALPKGTLTIDIEDVTCRPILERYADGGQGLDFGPYRFYEQRYVEEKKSWSEEELRPLTFSQLASFARIDLGSGVEIRAPHERTATVVEATFMKILGEAKRRHEAELDGLRAELSGLTRARPAYLLLPDHLRAIDGRIARLQDRTRPIEIWVVPRGKNISAMPQIRPEHRAMVKDSIAGVYSLDPRARFLFVPEESLDDGGQLLFLIHELYHLLDDVFASDAMRAAFDRIYQHTAAAMGPFANPYGARRREFISTMGELHQGAWGVEGSGWVARSQEELAGLFVSAARSNQT
jgi:hypothetical protein